MSNQEDIYQIEKILKHRVDKKRGKLYYIKWQGWNSNHNTWEPEENILDKDLLDAYNNAKTVRPPPKRTSTASQRRSSGTRAKKAKYDSDQDSSVANNSAASPIQSEGHFDVEDADKEPEEHVEPKAKSKSKSPVPEVPEVQPEPESIVEEPKDKVEAEEVEEVVEEIVEAPSEEPVEEEKVVEEKVEEEKVEEKEEEKKEEAESIEFYAYPTNGGGEDSNEFHVTEQNDPQCEVKIQVASQPSLTLQTETANDQTPDPVAETQEVVAQEEEKVFESNTASDHFE